VDDISKQRNAQEDGEAKTKKSIKYGTTSYIRFTVNKTREKGDWSCGVVQVASSAHDGG
jgi:hypothetical protein